MASFDNHYQIYLDKSKALARTIVIKSEASALAINQLVMRIHRDPKGETIQSDKRTWRYYLNICGQYHETNQRMRVVSMDTLEEIDFTQENLKLHRATLKEYQFGTRRYEELVARYPKQELLILGILYPADMERAIAAKDGTILSYPPHLVEFNEYSFIPKLQEWIDAYHLHWRNHGYTFSDELYTASNLAILYLNLVPAIMTIRKGLCKTNEAHSYHVRQYLSSNGFHDDFLDMMTVKQSLRFYQNIRWINRNAGKRRTQAWLIQEAMTVRGLPLSEFNLNHNSHDQIKRLKPGITFKKTSLNHLEDISEVDHLSLDELLAKERDVVKGNGNEIDHVRPMIQRSLEDAKSNVLKTKVLESKIQVNTDASIYSLEDMLLNYWLDLSHADLYKAIIHVNNPKTAERIPMRSKDAFVLFFYAYWKWAMNVSFPKVPAFYAERIPRKGLLTPEDMEVGLPGQYVDRAFNRMVLERMPKPGQMISVESFYQYVKEHHAYTNWQQLQLGSEQHYLLRAYKETAIARLYCDQLLHLAEPGIRYSDWLKQKAWVLDDFERDDYGELAKNILDEATGRNLLTTQSLRSVHAAMIKLMTQLSSYSVQFLSEVFDNNTLDSGFIYLRTDIPTESEVSSLAAKNTIHALDRKESDHEFLGQILSSESDRWEINEHDSSHVGDALLVDTLKDQMSSRLSLVALNTNHAFLADEVHPLNSDESFVESGLQNWLKLKLKDKKRQVTRWGEWYFEDECDRLTGLKDPITWVIGVNKISRGFELRPKPYLSLVGGRFRSYVKPALNLIDQVDGFKYRAKMDITQFIGKADGLTFFNRIEAGQPLIFGRVEAVKMTLPSLKHQP